MAADFATDFYGCPTFFITNAITEIAGSNVRVYHWDKRGGVLVPQFIAIVPAAELAVISRDVRETANKSLQGWHMAEVAH